MPVGTTPRSIEFRLASDMLSLLELLLLPIAALAVWKRHHKTVELLCGWAFLTALTAAMLRPTVVSGPTMAMTALSCVALGALIVEVWHRHAERPVPGFPSG